MPQNRAGQGSAQESANNLILLSFCTCGIKGGVQGGMVNARISEKWFSHVSLGEESAGIWYIGQVEAGGGSSVMNEKCH